MWFFVAVVKRGVLCVKFKLKYAFQDKVFIIIYYVLLRL